MGETRAFLEVRYAEGKLERLPDLAAELVRLNVDVIVTSTAVAALAARKATRSIPIVMWASGDAVRQGLVASLARPGGHVTGLTLISPELSRKRLEVLRDMLPKLTRVGVRDDLARAFASAARQAVQAILVFECGRLHPSAAQIVEFGRMHRLPAMYPLPRYPKAGGLMSYGANDLDSPRRAATYINKILKGAKTADLPVEQPTEFELVINLKTAKALGLTIPPSVLARADEVIE